MSRLSLITENLYASSKFSGCQFPRTNIVMVGCARVLTILYSYQHLDPHKKVLLIIYYRKEIEIFYFQVTYQNVRQYQIYKDFLICFSFASSVIHNFLQSSASVTKSLVCSNFKFREIKLNYLLCSAEMRNCIICITFYYYFYNKAILWTILKNVDGMLQIFYLNINRICIRWQIKNAFDMKRKKNNSVLYS